MQVAPPNWSQHQQEPVDGVEIRGNAKTELVAFCQRKSGKSMQQGDIEYVTEQFEDNWQACVKLTCLGRMEEFAGELCPNPKLAEQSAAKQALVAYAGEVRELQAQKRKAYEAMQQDPNKRARGELDETFGGEDPLDHSVKGKLHSAVKQLLGREPDQTDIVYDAGPIPSGMMQARLTLPSLGFMIPALKDMVFLGEPTLAKQGSRLSAAGRALRFVMGLPEGALVDLALARVSDPETSKPPRKGGGRGCKGGGCAAPWQMLNTMTAMMGKGKGKDGKGKGVDWTQMYQTMSTVFDQFQQAKGGKVGGGGWGGGKAGNWVGGGGKGGGGKGGGGDWGGCGAKGGNWGGCGKGGKGGKGGDWGGWAA